MNKPLLLVFHPDLNQSKVNRALVEALKLQNQINMLIFKNCITDL